jgi:hypothetical protein
MSKAPEQVDHQLLFSFAGGATPIKTTRAANRKAGRLATIERLHLPIVGQKRFEPKTGTPKTLADCPDTSVKPCEYIRCRWHLHRVDADTRAGRPGLGSAPRDARGLVMSVAGDLGEQRAGTTVVPRWLELERYCAVWVERDNDDEIVALNACREGEWDQFIAALHIGEDVDAQNENGDVVAKVNIRREPSNDDEPVYAIGLDRDPGEFMLKLVRKRGIESCALHAIARMGRMSNEQAGDCIDRHRTLVARELREAVTKACETAEEMGMEREDFVRALMSMGDG